MGVNPSPMADSDPKDQAGGKNESRDERLDRELIELLNELRVTLPGVQVLFAFLLVAPFSQGFARINDLQKYGYLTALFFTALGRCS